MGDGKKIRSVAVVGAGAAGIVTSVALINCSNIRLQVTDPFIKAPSQQQH